MELNYSDKTISLFENGKLSNIYIFMYYLNNILDYEDKVYLGVI